MDRREPQRIQPAAFEPLTAATAQKKSVINPTRLVVAIVGLTFTVALWFLLTARSLELQIVAEEPGKTSIQGLAIPFGDRYLIRPGNYIVEAFAQGYYPFSGEIEVSKDATQIQEILLQPLPGRISIDTSPANAAVFVDGEAIGASPLQDASIDAGRHELLIEAPRYLPYQQALEVTGRDVQQNLDVTLAPAWGDISISSVPEQATVLVDGEPVGETPVTAEILSGDHALELRLAGFATESLELTVEAGVAQSLETLVLTPASGVLALASIPTGANVSVDGEFAGQTPLELELAPGSDRRISLSKAGYRRSSITVKMEAGSSLERSVSLKPLLGELLVKVSPEDAELFVNGARIGSGTQTLSLPAVTQRIEARLEGYESVTRSITPRAGLEQLLEITLLTPEAARKARLKPLYATAAGQEMILMNPIDSAKNEFSMGASRRDPGRRANEVLHPVRLERPFYIQKTEVTNAQFRAFDSSHGSGQVEGNSLNREKQPVVQVSWQRAASFCNWLSSREGLAPFYMEQQGIIVGFDKSSTGYRLPSEAEWAWVARINGESLQRFTWGEDFPPEEVTENVADNSSAYVTGRILRGYDDGYVVSAPVASFKANHRGVFDLGGNVSEWVHDVYKIPASSGVVQTDPLGGQRGDNYTLRGASWALGRLPELRLSYRDYGEAGRDDVGFRVARYAE
ncbi:MAG: PEGA domain-containing protein [Pseudomonadota bacterium]